MMNTYKTYIISLLVLLLIGNNANAVTNFDNPISIDSRIKTFVYNRNEIYTVILNYGYQSYIEFSTGETIKTIAMGENSSFKVNASENKLYIRPIEKYGKTNMLIETSKGRNYAFDLICKTDDNSTTVSSTESTQSSQNLNMDYSVSRDLAYIVRFYYPKTEDEFELNNIKLPEISPPSQLHNTLEDSHENLIQNNDTRYNYSYIAHKDSEDIVPVELFDDGKITYFRFSKIKPKIFVQDNKGRDLPADMLSLNQYIMINGVYKNLSIRYKNKYVKITNKAF